jgi:hypothetical protein
VVCVYVKLGTERNILVLDLFILVAFHMGELESGSDGTHHIPVRFEGGVGIFNSDGAARVQLGDKAFVTHGELDTSG